MWHIHRDLKLILQDEPDLWSFLPDILTDLFGFFCFFSFHDIKQ